MRRSALPLVCGRLGPGADVLELEAPAGESVREGNVGRAVVGHHLLDTHAVRREELDSAGQEGHGSFSRIST